MNVGDKIIIDNIEYTVWLVEETTIHLLDNNNNNGIAISK